MGQLFHPRANTIFRSTVLGVPVVLLAVGWGVRAWQDSSYHRRVFVAYDQPVPFSHRHHVTGLGLDCRYCHTSVEKSASAGVPATQTCMNCHSQLWTNAAMLAPVRESYASGKAIRWNKLHDLPDFVFFDHSIHINKGVGCVTCHGQVNEMPLTWKTKTLEMKWCLDCHRDPGPNLRPREEVFNLTWKPPAPPPAPVATQEAEGEKKDWGKVLLDKNHVNVNGLTDCSTCHR